jgi:hypothetical protein
MSNFILIYVQVSNFIQTQSIKREGGGGGGGRWGADPPAWWRASGGGWRRASRPVEEAERRWHHGGCPATGAPSGAQARWWAGAGRRPSTGVVSSFGRLVGRAGGQARAAVET